MKRLLKVVNYCTCYIDDQTVDYAGHKGIAKGLDIFPETIEEAVWDKAKELYFKK